MTQTLKNKPAIHALIVAAGKGSRFGASLPKQYTPLAGRTVLEHSVAALSASRFINALHLVVAPDDSQARSLTFAVPVYISLGGSERWQSVQNGVEAIARAGAAAADLVLIHDAARPCVLAKHIDAVINVAKTEPYGAILGVPIADTVKRVETGLGATIVDTLDRRDLWLAQTPQVFRLAALQHVLAHISKDKLTVTDEASAFERLGYPIRMVKGSQQNIKLTYAEDLALIEKILQ